MADVVFAAGTAVMRAMQMPFDTIQHHGQPGPSSVIGLGAQMCQQRFDIAPVDVTADRFREYLFKRFPVLVTHDHPPPAQAS